jgi:hypothetical protein
MFREFRASISRITNVRMVAMEEVGDLAETGRVADYRALKRRDNSLDGVAS